MCEVLTLVTAFRGQELQGNLRALTSLCLQITSCMAVWLWDVSLPVARDTVLPHSGACRKD